MSMIGNSQVIPANFGIIDHQVARWTAPDHHRRTTHSKHPVGVSLGDQLSRAFASEVLEQSPSHDLADLRFVVRHEIARHASDDLSNLVLPVRVSLRHFHLDARQAYDSRRSLPARRGHGEVLDEGVETLRHAAVPVDEVQDLIE